MNAFRFSSTPSSLPTGKTPQSPSRVSPGAVARQLATDSSVLGGGDEVWLFSFLDMMLLLLTLFVFLFAYAKFQAEHTPAGSALPVVTATVLATPQADRSHPHPPVPSPSLTDKTPDQTSSKGPASLTHLPLGDASALTWVFPEPWQVATAPPIQTMAQPPVEPALAPVVSNHPDLLETIFHRLLKAESPRHLEIARQGQGLRAELGSDVLFSPGKAELAPGGEVLLARIVETLRGTPLSLSVEGHTDNRPIANQRFPSNWELSGLRAAIVARYLIAQGLPSAHIQTVGYADTRPRAPNTTAEGRARNRRVTLVLDLAKEPTSKPASPGTTVSLPSRQSQQG
ncbi:MAG: OmpA family protein [Pseudomonadota bacterium]